jgi:hypothetical protein
MVYSAPALDEAPVAAFNTQESGSEAIVAGWISGPSKELSSYARYDPRISSAL